MVDIQTLEEFVRSWLASMGVPPKDHDAILEQVKTNHNLTLMNWEMPITKLNEKLLSATKKFATGDALVYLEHTYPEQMNFFATVFGFDE